jgi:hypothetical protein
VLPDAMVWRLEPGRVYALDAGPGAPSLQVRLLRVDDDGLHHPVPWVRALDGPSQGQRLHVDRWRLRDWAGRGMPAAWLSLALGVVSGGLLWAVLAAQRARSTAARQAE